MTRNKTISRRDFIGVSAVGGAGLIGHNWLSHLSAAHAATNAATSGNASWVEATIPQLQAMMASGQITSRELTKGYLQRIDNLNPLLHAVIETNPQAVSIAVGLDNERRAGYVRGPLHGIPVIVKDNIATDDTMQTTAGSLALLNNHVPADAPLVAQLRAAGAIILGKANLSEWANWRGWDSISGWSARGGFTVCPYVLDDNPWGSSSGSAVAAAANLCAVAVGTETDGSIMAPSHANSAFGLKPTLGRISGAGIIPIAHSQDTAGPMARSVTDGAILLGALAGADPDDPITKVGGLKGAPDYTRFLDPGGLRGARIGIPRKGLFGQSPAADRLAEAAIEALKNLGAVIVDPADIATVGEMDKSELDVLLHEFKADLNAYFASLGPKAPVRSLADAIAFNEAHKDREMPYFGQEIFLQAEKKGPLTSRAYLDALAKNHRLSRAMGIDLTMEKYTLDALVAPTSGPPSLTDLVNGDCGPGGSSTIPAVAGYPHLTVPMGYVFGLPVGLSFFGRAWSEGRLIALAYAFEQATRHRQGPRFLRTAELPA